MRYKVEPVSTAIILRDYALVPCIDAEHKMLVDIGDFLYNNQLGAEYLTPEARKVYDNYGKDYFDKVLKDASALDSQMGDYRSTEDLVADYNDFLSGAMTAKEENV